VVIAGAPPLLRDALKLSLASHRVDGVRLLDAEPPRFSAPEVVLWLSVDPPPPAPKGVRFLRPPLAAAAASRIAFQLRLIRELDMAPSESLTGPLDLAVGRVSVDDPSCPTFVLQPLADDEARVVATARVDALLAGQGRL
jgi:hypothetical protein